MSPKKKRGASGETFKIVTVADFMNVPRHRLAKCLREFRVMLDMTHDFDALFKAAAKTQGVPAADARINLLPAFEWIDDDEGRIHLTINTGNKPEAESPAEAAVTPPTAIPHHEEQS